ncbi:MAG: hypothetical protein WBE34_10990 [Candidatus Nitrosopolaris sp.]
MSSAPNKGHVVDQNVQIAASGSDVYFTWWTNKTGVSLPVFDLEDMAMINEGKTEQQL